MVSRELRACISIGKILAFIKDANVIQTMVMLQLVLHVGPTTHTNVKDAWISAISFITKGTVIQNEMGNDFLNEYIFEIKYNI